MENERMELDQNRMSTLNREKKQSKQKKWETKERKTKGENPIMSYAGPWCGGVEFPFVCLFQILLVVLVGGTLVHK